KEGKFDRAEAILKDALVKMPDTAAIHNQLAIMYEQKARRGIPGTLDLAMKNYRDAISIEPDKPSLRVNLAQLLIRQKAYDEAAGHLTHALNNGPETADAHYNMGMIYSTRGDLNNEKLSYEKALVINPDHPQSLFRLGRIFEKQQSLDEAKTYYQRAVDQAPENPLLLTTLGRVLMAKSELHTAESLFRKAIRYQPRYAEAHFQLGGLYLTNGNLVEAQKKFVETLKFDRNHRGAALALQQIQSASNSGKK
ncbi:MAG: tetratricopeptide repeat protein, partial [Pirellulaceae bacterium]|nr:tetratricopeptide repeat protein [Pirellulaceae bacterium]